MSRNRVSRTYRSCFGRGFAAGRSIKNHRAYCSRFWTKAALKRILERSHKWDSVLCIIPEEH